MAWKMSAAKRRALVKLQLRDKNGRWIEMGRGVKWYSSKRKKEIGGTVVGSQGDYALVRLNKENPTHEPALVKVPARHIEVVSSKATLSDPKAPKSNLETPEFEKPEAVGKADVDLAAGPQVTSPATILPNLSDSKDDYSISDTADGNTYISRKDGEQLYFPARGLEVGDELISPDGADETKPFSIGKGWATKGAERLNPNGPKLGKVISVEGDRYAVVQMAGGHTVDDKKNPGEQTDTVTVGLTNRVIKATPGLKEALGDKISNETYAERGEDEQEIDPESPEAQSDHVGREVPEDQQDQPELPPLDDDEDEYKETIVTIKAVGHTLEEIKFAMETAESSDYDHGIRMRQNGKMEIYDLDGAIMALQGPLDVINDNYDLHTGKYEGNTHTPRQANAIKNGLEKIINHLTELKAQQADKEANNKFLNGYDIDKDRELGKVRANTQEQDYVVERASINLLDALPVGSTIMDMDPERRTAGMPVVKLAQNRWAMDRGLREYKEYTDGDLYDDSEQGVRFPDHAQNDFSPEEIATIIERLDRKKAGDKAYEDMYKQRAEEQEAAKKAAEEPVTDEPATEEPEVPETPAETPEDPSEPSQTEDPTVSQIKKGLAQLDQDVEDIENHNLSDEDRAAAIEEARFSFTDANGEQWTLAANPEGDGEWSYALTDQQGEDKATLLPAKYENYDQLAEAIASSVNSTVARNNAEQEAAEKPAEPEAPKDEPLNANGLTEEEQKNADAYVRMAARAENQGKFEQADRLIAQLDELMKMGNERKNGNTAVKPQEPAEEPKSTPVEPEPIETPEEAPEDIPALIEPDTKPELPPLEEGEELELPIPGVKKQGKRADKSAQHLKTLDGLEEGDRVSHTNAHDETSTYQKHPDGTWDLLDPEALDDEDVSPLEEAIAASDIANRHKRGDLVVQTAGEREEAEREEARAAKERAKGYKPIPTKPIDKSQPTGRTRAEEEAIEANSADKPWSAEEIASDIRDWFDFAQAVKNGDSRAIETMAQNKRRGDEETTIIVNDKGQPFDLTLTYNDDGDPVVRLSNFDDSSDIYGDFDIDASVMPKQLSTLIHESINADDVAAAVAERNGSNDVEENGFEPVVTRYAGYGKAALTKAISKDPEGSGLEINGNNVDVTDIDKAQDFVRDLVNEIQGKINDPKSGKASKIGLNRELRDISALLKDINQKQFERDGKFRPHKSLRDLEETVTPEEVPVSQEEVRKLPTKDEILAASPVSAEEIASGPRGQYSSDLPTDHPGLTALEQDAVNKYMLHGEPINKAASGRDELTPEVAGRIAALDQTIAESRTKAPMTVFRAFASDPERLKKSLADGMITGSSYNSSSVSEDYADQWGSVHAAGDKSFVMLEISTPEGFTAHAIDYPDEFKGLFGQEQEVLFPRGTSFKIESTEAYTNSAGKVGLKAKVTPVLTDENHFANETSASKDEPEEVKPYPVDNPVNTGKVSYGTGARLSEYTSDPESGVVKSSQEGSYDIIDLNKGEATLKKVLASVEDAFAGYKEQRNNDSSVVDRYQNSIDEIKDLIADVQDRREREEGRGSKETTPEVPEETPVEEATPEEIAPEEVAPEEVSTPARGKKLTVQDGEEHPLDRLGVERRTPEAVGDEKYAPTQQQQDVIDSVLGGLDTLVQAKAGSGKTTTLQAIATRVLQDRPNDQILYVAFNKTVQEEAKTRMPSNVEPRTGHSISFNWVPTKMRNRFKDKDALQLPAKVANHLGISGRGEYKADDMASDVMTIVGRYSFSADDEVGLQHIPDFLEEKDPKTKAALVEYAKKAWADIIDHDNGKLKVEQDHMRKLWALSRPDFSKLGGGVKASQIVFIDEAQDTPPVLAKVIADQKIQKVVVGDADQAIYGFTGATDYLSQAKGDIELPLNMSWRFGPEVASVGNRFLELLESDGRVVGGGPSSEIVTNMDDADAILVRSNSGMLAEIIRELERGRVVGISEKTMNDMRALIATARWLKFGADPKWKPSNLHEKLAPYRSWEEVNAASAKGGDQSLTSLKNMVDEYGVGKLKELMDKVVIDKKLEEVPAGGKFLDLLTFTSTATETTVGGKPWDTVAAKDLLKQTGFRYLSTGEKYVKGDKKGQFKKAWQAVGTPEEQEAMIAAFRKLDSPEAAEENYVKPDVIVSTAHKAKGLEWDRVRIGDDFWQPKVDEETGELVEMVSDDELRLAYVAVTRAQKALDVGSLGYVYQYTSENGGSPKTEAPEEPREDEDQPTSLEPDTTPEDHSVKEEEETGLDQPVEPTVPEEPAEAEPAEPSQPVNVGMDLDDEGLTPAERRHAEDLEQRVADVYRGNSDEDVKELENELFDLYRTGLLRTEGEDIPEVQPKAKEPEVVEPEVTEPEVVEPVEEPVDVPVEEPVVEEPVKVQPPAPDQTEEPEFDDEGLTPAERQRADELEQFIYDIFRGRGQGNRKALEKELEGIYAKGQERLKPKAAQKSKPVAPKPAETTPETPESKPETPTVPEETEAERTARTRRNFSESDRVVIGGDGSEIRANTTGIHRKLGKIEITEVQPGAGRLKFKDPVTGKIKSTDASFVTADTDEAVEGTSTPTSGDAFLPADTPVNTIIFDPEQQKEVFISANKQKVAPQGRVRHSKKGEGTVRAIYPGADGMGSIRVTWDDGTDSRVKGTTLEGLDSPSLLSEAGDDYVAKKLAEIFPETEPETAETEPQIVADSDNDISYDAPSLPTEIFVAAEIMMLVGDDEDAKGTKDPWGVAGKVYGYLMKTPTGVKDLDGFKKKLPDGVTYTEARNYIANMKKHYQDWYNVSPNPEYRDAVQALDVVLAKIDEKLANPVDMFNSYNSSARYSKPLSGWTRTDLIKSTKDKNDPLRIMEESVIQDSYTVNTVVSMVDDSGKLLATFQKNAQGNWIHRDNTGAVAMVMPGSFPVNPDAKYVVDEQTGSKSTQKPFVRSQFWNNLPVGARVEGVGLGGSANFVKVREGLWKNERGFYAVINDLVRPVRILEAEGIEIEEVRPVGEDTFGNIAKGNSRSKLLYDAPEGSQFSFVDSPESVFVKEAGLWTERVSGVRTGKTFSLASAEGDLTKDGSPDIIVRLPNGQKVADLIDPSLDESKFEIDTYDGQDVSFSDYDFKTSKFNPASEISKVNGIRGKANDVFVKLNGNTFYNGQRVFDKNLKYLGKIGAVMNYDDDESTGRINVIGTGGSVLEDRGGVWYTLKDVKRMGLLSEDSPKYRDDEINYDTVSVFDIQRALQKKYPGMTFQFTGLDIESAKDYARTVERILAKFPQLRHSLHKITAEDFGSYMAGAVAINRGDNWGGRSVSFNSGRGFSRKPWQQGVQQMGRRGELIKAPEGREMEYMMTHEFGHVLDYLTGNIDERRILELISKALGRTVTQNNKALRDELLRKRLVSEYSTRGTASFRHMNKGNAHDIHIVELVAESFADVEVNGANASPISKVVHKELMDKLKEY